MKDEPFEVPSRIRYRYWASPGQPGQTLDDLVLKLVSLGNQILRVDTENGRVLVAEYEAEA